MGDDDARDAQSLVKLPDELDEDCHGDGVLPGERLVVHDELRIERDGTGKSDAAGHAARELRGHEPCGAAKTDGLELHEDKRPHELLREAKMLSYRIGNIVEHAHVGEERAALEEHAHALPDLEEPVAPQGGDADVTVIDDVAGVRPQLPADKAEKSGLSGAARPHHSGDRAAPERHADAVIDDVAAAGEGEIPDFY